ncbi:hypothetical protein V1478_010841 [Vespula squamosa]|uniref:Uncharacterized protein n=1 Tax=Vespula squamosa TaxID=30214 RepID=A0ABD2AFI6_VESSQ
MTIPTTNRINLDNYQMNYRGNQLRSLELIHQSDYEDYNEDDFEIIDFINENYYENDNIENVNVAARTDNDEDRINNNNNNESSENVPVENIDQSDDPEENQNTINENRMHSVNMLQNMLQRLYASYPNALRYNCDSVLYDL